MPEDLNAEIAGGLAETADPAERASRARWERTVEIVEAIVLAIVAVATAWSGYQAARWDGHQAELYGHASTVRIEADQELTLGGQQKLLDVATFNTWIQAVGEGHDELAALYERRFSPEFKVAFDAWRAAGPISDPGVPPGPGFMPEYHNPQLEHGQQLNEEADAIFAEGTRAREIADDYIRITVVLASVLFLLAIAQRFQVRGVRIAMLAVSGVLLLYGVGTILTFRRL
jgi:hypothetical protein